MTAFTAPANERPPAPSRRRRVFFNDARFFIGLALVLVSVAGVWFVVSAGRATSPLIVATRTIVPGERIEPGDVRVVEVALGASETTYAAAADIDERIATRTLVEGELVPRAALGAPADASTTTVVVRSSMPIPATLAPGARVEVWGAPQVERGIFGVPQVLIAQAVLARIVTDGRVVSDGTTAVELVVDRGDVGLALAAQAGEAALSVVPLTGDGGVPAPPGESGADAAAGPAAGASSAVGVAGGVAGDGGVAP